MANRRKKPVIPFDFEPDYSIPMEYIRHQLRTRTENDEDVVEEKLQRLHEEASPYEILQFFSAFQRVRSSMNWAEGPKLYQKFPLHLNDYHLEIWESLTNQRDRTTDNFNLQLQEFKAELLRGYKYEDQMNYLRSLKKPGKMEPSQFLLKLRATNRMATQLPDALVFE